MRLRNGSVLTLLCLATFLSVSWITVWFNQRGNGIDEYQKDFLDLRQRLLTAEQENLKKSRELSTVLDEIKRSLAERRNGTSNHTDDTRWKEFNFTSKAPGQFVNLYYYLPHLLEHEDSLRPNVLFGQGRTGVTLVMGIPTVKRDKKSYLMDTLSSLFYELSPGEKNECLLIVFIAEDDAKYVNAIADSVNQRFPNEIQSGLLEVIAPPVGYYPDFSTIKETFGDSKERVRWRTKQNLDYSFLMLYAQPKGVFYLQLEDDIIAKPQYFPSIKTFALQQTSDDWVFLEFSQLGFIGKLFKAKDLPLIVEFFLMFFKDKPIDWLLDHILWVKVCNPEKDSKHCDRQKANLRIRYRPSLFQHMGTHSSLAGKIQNLKDKDFGKAVLHKSHPNPSAKVSTSMKEYQQFTLEKAYRGEDCFWAFAPAAGDHILITFFHPLVVDGYLFRSGNVEHPGDKLFNTTVEVLPAEPAKFEDLKENGVSKYQKTQDGFVRIGAFVDGLAEGSISPLMGKIMAIRLTVLSESPVWALISEIFIKMKS
ncbi:alpha-1,3-mannosyl-glycoprotein 4-beta-N-acetylglucosaminyltransferase-like protein MGAT4D isoform X2 [Ambystoma mexicanum]|uniref:alpha-1,3-mannosyl-glycoprotein 4-beta-N-acetylglucosaminyltransferase-like protein MGAT4D isoform X2 n=1 Tax=Ambystoma mexicanum TaxID=8296 RepID=UPI0037E81B53